MILYIDPGAGSMLIQGLLAVLLAVPFFFRSAIARGVAVLRGRPRRSADDVAPENSD
jgi:hypothetical protein